MPTGSPPVRVLDTDDPVAAFLAAARDDTPVVLGSSGSSGPARGVVRSPASWVASFPHVTALLGTGPASRVWVPGPLHATMNLFAAVHARWVGADLVAEPGQATHAHLSPTALHRLLDGAPAERTPRAGTVVVVAGDRLPASLAGRAESAGLRVHHYYGAAELSFVAWGRDQDSLRLFPEVAAEVRDGEVWVRSPYLCQGYDGSPGPLRRDACGFATVGDRGRLDGDRLVVTGRAGAVTTAGGTVHLADVEARLRGEAAGEVVAVGLPHERLGEVLAVVLTERSDHARLLARARGELRGPQRPRLWFHLADLPHTDAGKIDRAGLGALLSDPAGPARRLA